MATGLGVGVRIEDDRVREESWQRVRGQEIRRENPREREHVAESGVDLERVQALEIGFYLSQSVHLDAGIKFLVQQDRQSYG